MLPVAPFRSRSQWRENHTDKEVLLLKVPRSLSMPHPRPRFFLLGGEAGPVGDLSRDWSPIHQRPQGCQWGGTPLIIILPPLTNGIHHHTMKAPPCTTVLGPVSGPFFSLLRGQLPPPLHHHPDTTDLILSNY